MSETLGGQFHDQPTRRLRERPAVSRDPSAIDRLRVGFATHVGRVRSRNEDSIHAEPTDSRGSLQRGWFGAVADGVGGRPAGEVASRLAIQTARDTFYWEGPDDTSERLLRAVERANGAVFRASQRSPERAGMASTLTAVVVKGAALYVAQIGDSRAYLIRDGEIHRLTLDHSWVGEGVRAGLLTSEEARVHPRRNVVTRVLGEHPEVQVDLVEGELVPGDVLVLCTDGLHGPLTDDEIVAAVRVDPQETADALVALANERGGRDNISVIVARLGSDDDHVVAAVPPRRYGPLLLVGLAALAAVVTFWLLLLLESLLLPRDTPAAPAVPAATARPDRSGEPTPVAGSTPPTVVTALVTPVALATPVSAPPTVAGGGIGGDQGPAAGRLTARFRQGETVRIRTAPRLEASTVLDRLTPDDPRHAEPIEIQAVRRGDTPTDSGIPVDDRTDVWYQIAWPGGAGGSAFVHCSAILIVGAPARTCSPN